MGGFSLVEALIAMLLFAVGFLAIAGLQLRGMQASRISFQSSTAMRLAEALAEQILANKQVLITNKDIYHPYAANAAQCYDSGVICTAAQIAASDVDKFSTMAAGLQDFSFNICYDDSINDSTAAIANFSRCMPNDSTLVIKMKWRAVARGGSQRPNQSNATLDNFIFLPVLTLL